MKTINWTKVNANTVAQSGDEQTPNVWKLISNQIGSQADTASSKQPVEELVDFEELEELFCIANHSQSNNPLPGCTLNLQTSQQSPSSLPNSPRFSRRSMQATNNSMLASSDSSSPENSLDYCSDILINEPQLTLLDSKRSLNVNVYLKQFKVKNTKEIIKMIDDESHQLIGMERLSALKHLLPDPVESTLLRNHAHNCSRMPPAEKFLYTLIQVPDYQIKIEFMLLREEYDSNIPTLRQAFASIQSAARQLMQSGKLQEILALILVSGNFLNFVIMIIG